MNNLIKYILFLTVALFLVFLGVNRWDKRTAVIGGGDRLSVTTSFYPLYFFAVQIAGDKADVYNITPASAEPHDYEPTAQDVVRIEKSKLLILNGSGLETWGDKMKASLAGHNVIIVTAGNEITLQPLDDKGKMIQDPHIWLSPTLAKKEVENILSGFVKADSKNSDYYSGNAALLIQKLNQLNTAFRQGLSSCVQQDIITSHAAFGYLAADYGFNQLAISGLSPDEEPSSKKMAEVSQFAKNHNIRYIFFENLVSPKLSETIAREVGAKTLVLDPIEGISDAGIRQGKNYFTLMQDNLSRLKEALVCQ